MTLARWSRVLAFCAGPQNTTFYACDGHLRELQRGDVTSVHYPITGHGVQPVVQNADDVEAGMGIECDLCREG